VSGSVELLVLRLALIAIVFAFVFAAALSMRAGLRPAAVVRTVRPVIGPRFVVIAPGETGLRAGAEIPVAGEMSLGRDSTNGIVLGDPSVSSVHANLERVRNGWRLTDHGSTNGTMLNGKRVDGRGVVLKGGERVALGTVVLRFQA
jgi:hypothetical protein